VGPLTSWTPRCQWPIVVSMKIIVYDKSRNQWRFFYVIPEDDSYVAKCRNGIHQFQPTFLRCSCGEVTKWAS
jgi:hypothetical protein